MAIDARITEWLRQNEAAQLDFLASLVRLPTDNPPGDCAAAARIVVARLRALGLEVEEDEVPAAECMSVGMRSCVNLIVRQRFGPGPVIALNAHGDVVPPGQGWTHDPYGAEVVNDPIHGPTMFGRGVAVSKSDIATYTWALLALREAARQGLALHGTLELHITWDEETGGNIGPRRLLEQGLTKPDLAIAAGFAYSITYAHNGCLHLEVTVHGKQAHAAMPQTGTDAIEAANRLLTDLYAYRRELASQCSATPGIEVPTLNVGLIQGGINTNVVPDQVSFRIDRRVIPEESMQQAALALRQRLEAAARRCDPSIRLEIREVLRADPLIPLPGSERLIEVIGHHAQEVIGERIPAHGVPLYTDARHYAAHGIPIVLYGAGPRTLMEARGHNADENLRLGDLHKATQVVAASCADLLRA
jgi:acetylornithine deacetylase/succinyl-diaminopimelate desuccinylase-like protein